MSSRRTQNARALWRNSVRQRIRSDYLSMEVIAIYYIIMIVRTVLCIDLNRNISLLGPRLWVEGIDTIPNVLWTLEEFGTFIKVVNHLIGTMRSVTFHAPRELKDTQKIFMPDERLSRISPLFETQIRKRISTTALSMYHVIHSMNHEAQLFKQYIHYIWFPMFFAKWGWQVGVSMSIPFLCGGWRLSTLISACLSRPSQEFCKVSSYGFIIYIITIPVYIRFILWDHRCQCETHKVYLISS